MAVSVIFWTTVNAFDTPSDERVLQAPNGASRLLTQPLAPARERRAIKWQLVPEHHSPTEVREMRVLHPSLAQRLVGEVVHMLENEQPGHQPRRQRRLPRSHPTHRAEASRQKVPIDLPRQPHQRMAKVDDLLERRAEPGVPGVGARPAHPAPPT